MKAAVLTLAGALRSCWRIWGLPDSLGLGKRPDKPEVMTKLLYMIKGADPRFYFALSSVNRLEILEVDGAPSMAMSGTGVAVRAGFGRAFLFVGMQWQAVIARLMEFDS